MTTERMPGDQGPAEPTPESARAQVADLAERRLITRDQERIADTALQDPDFALLANRALNQGTDPELLLRVVPHAVERVAYELGLTLDEARKAIQTAHIRGPGSLPVDSKEEWLWLILAKYSVDEAMKPKEPERVLIESARMLAAFENYATDPDILDIGFEEEARAFREEILRRTQAIGTAPLGTDVPLYGKDLGFYAAYRSGKPVAAVRTPDGLTFYGTDGSVTLEAAGITVDKQLSPTFGIVFPPKP